MKKTLAILLAMLMVLGAASLASAEGVTEIPVTIYLSGYVGIYADQDAYIDYVEDEFYKASGIKLDFTILGSSHEDSYTMISTKIAGGDLDFAKSASPGYMQGLASQGMLEPLDDLLAQYGEHMVAAVPALGWNFGRVDDTGYTYLFPYLGDYSMYVCTWVRWDLFEKAGFTEYPTKVSELVDMMYKVMEENPDLVGVTSRYPNWPWQHSFCCWYPYKDNDYSFISCDENGEPYPFIYANNLPMYFDNPGYVEFIGKLAQWYQDGIIHNEIWTMDNDQLNTLLAQHRVFVMTEGWSRGQSIADQYAGVDPRYPLPEGAEPEDWRLLATVENDYVAPGAPMVWASGLEGLETSNGGLIKGTKAAAELVQYMDWCFTGEDVYRTIAWGIEGQHWYWDEDGIKQSVLDEAGNGVISGVLSFPVGSYYDPYAMSVSNNYIGTEWEQVWGTKGVDWTAFFQDTGSIPINTSEYDLEVNEMASRAGELVNAMFSGEMTAEEGIATLKEDLKAMGWDEYWAAYTEQYKAGMAEKWGMEDYYNHP